MTQYFRNKERGVVVHKPHDALTVAQWLGAVADQYEEVQLAPVDAIVIDRADLPAVERDPHGYLRIGEESPYTAGYDHRAEALRRLALADHVDAWEGERAEARDAALDAGLYDDRPTRAEAAATEYAVGGDRP